MILPMFSFHRMTGNLELQHNVGIVTIMLSSKTFTEIKYSQPQQLNPKFHNVNNVMVLIIIPYIKRQINKLQNTCN